MIEILKTKEEVRAKVRQWRREGLTVGLVPTMGYLHEGHISLVEHAVRDNDRVVVSNFVNPTQFAAGEDLEKYPRDLERDARMCNEAGADVMFAPEVKEMYGDTYPEGFVTFVGMNGLQNELCGRSRPGHFNGVCTVCSKLFNIVTPDRAYYGKKDAQQLAIIRQMVRDLDFGLEIVGCPTVREEDGLAKSSRNSYLNEEERAAAPVLRKALMHAETMIKGGERDVAKVIGEMTAMIEAEPLARIDYIDIVDPLRIEKIDVIPESACTADGSDTDDSVLIALAVFIGKTRLIDNITL